MGGRVRCPSVRAYGPTVHAAGLNALEDPAFRALSAYPLRLHVCAASCNADGGILWLSGEARSKPLS